MFGNLFQNLFGKNPPHQVHQPSTRTARLPFNELDRFRQGLAEQARQYVITGEPSGTPGEVSAAVTAQTFAHSFQNDLRKLAHGFGKNPEGLVRLVRLQKALGGTTPSHGNTPHLDTVPEDVLRLFALFSNSGIPQGLEVPTTADDVVAATHLLGGSEADFVTYLLPKGRYDSGVAITGLTQASDDRPAYRDRVSPDIVIDAISRTNATFRTLALQQFRSKSADASPAFLDFLFEQFEESSEKLREAARARLGAYDAEIVEEKALARLDGGKATLRASMVSILGRIGTPSAVAALEARRSVEKTQSVLNAIDAFLAAPVSEGEAPSGGYLDIFGATVTIPEREKPVDDGRRPLGKDFLQRMKAHEAEVNQSEQESYEKVLAYRKTHGHKNNPPEQPKPASFAQAWFDALNATAKQETRLHVPWRHSQPIYATISTVLDELPLRRVIELSMNRGHGLASILNYGSDPLSAHVAGKLHSGELALSQVLQIAEDRQIPVNYEKDRLDNPITARFIRSQLAQDRYGREAAFFPDMWEVAATQIPMLADALPPRNVDIKTNLRALEIAATFPSLPQALLQPVLMAAIDERPRLQRPAQRLLVDAPNIDDLLITLLDDKKQGVRANAARFLAKRGSDAALPALVKRLKREKSDVARADLISAVSLLGGDTQPYLGKEALLKEARTLVSKLPDAKYTWLDLNTAPQLVWSDGKAADPVLLDAWLRLALKLKSPMGSPLFKLYFEQLTPESAATVSDWVLESWIAFDTYQPGGDELRTRAEEQAKVAAGTYKYMNYDQWVAHFLRTMRATYVNSAADSKGLLALAHFATPSQSATRIAAYLKKHGRRVSQAKSLVETLFGMGTKDAVQVLVATATRFRQRTVRELAETLVKDLADARGWTEDALADRSVPTGGFEDDGILHLPVGEEEKPYLARLGNDLSVKLYNPDGKEVKSIPTGKDENTKASKALLSAAKKTIKTATAQQSARFYEAMLTPRVWELEDWQNDLTRHPILNRLIERLIWRGLDKNGAPVATLRLTPEGELLNADGDEVDLKGIVKLDLAHTAHLAEADCAAWRQHLKDFEVTPLFEQVSRPVRTLDEEQKRGYRLDDREGWLMTTFKLRSAAKKLGYERGVIEDGGGFSTYRKEFRSAQIWADLKFTGSYVGEEDVDAALEYMQFSDIAVNGRVLTLGKVPPLLLSEVWNDLHEIAKVGAYDPDWRKKGLY